MARGLRSIAARLTPVDAAPVTDAEPAPVEDTAGGPPGHWLEMVRTRAPGLHVSLQERGVARMPRRPLPVVTSVPAASALELRERQPDTPVRRVPSAPPVAAVPGLPLARPLRPSPERIPTPAAQHLAEAPPDLEPHAWASAASDDDQEDWTRVPTRRTQVATSASPAPIPAAVPAVRRLSAVDAAVAESWHASAEVPPHSTDARTDPRRVPTRPELRPLPAVTPPEMARHSAATPVFAPSRDEDQALRRPVRARATYPTPVPTPWRIEALQATMDEPVAQRFPSLPDEVAPDAAAPVPTSPPASAPIARPAVPAPVPSSRSPQAPGLNARRRHDSSDLVGAWPTLPAARIPALRRSAESAWSILPDADRWPELPGDESDEGNDPDLSLPADHRERLAHEQRGLAWNG